MKKIVATLIGSALFAPAFALAWNPLYEGYGYAQYGYQPVYQYPSSTYYGYDSYYMPQQYQSQQQYQSGHGYGTSGSLLYPQSYSYNGLRYDQPVYGNYSYAAMHPPQVSSYPTGDHDFFGNSLCRWSNYPTAAPCGSDPQQPIYDPYTQTWY